jgi:hypothetical protein
MSESLFYFGDDNVLKRMNPAEFVTEADFQKLLAQFPDLLTDADFGEGTPRRWMLVTREAPVSDSQDGGGRWSLDHLFLDQDAVPTLVEVKRASDTRARREVVAQMLDYAANATSWWKVEELKSLFAKSSEQAGTTEQVRLSELLRTDEPDAEAFWRSVQTNLASGRIRLIFVADRVAQELATIIQFLNEQMQYATVLALELRHFSNGAERILAPRLIGMTARAAAQRSIVAPAKSSDDWVTNVLSPPAQAPVRRFIELIQSLGGSTKVAGQSLAIDYGPEAIRVAYLKPTGRLALALWQLAKLKEFSAEDSRMKLVDEFESHGFESRDRNPMGEPSLQLESLRKETGWESLRILFNKLFQTLSSGA